MISRSALFCAFSLSVLAVAEAQDATPIWKLPFGALSNSVERPLFSRTRRPPPQIRRAASESDIGRGSGQDNPGLEMVGFMFGPDGLALAVVRESASQNIKRLHIGDAMNGWEIVAIERREITLRQKDRTITVRMQGRLPDKADDASNITRPLVQPSATAPFFPMPAPLPRPCCQ